MPFKYCKRPCQYRAGDYSPNGCDYILLTGEPRGCAAGEHCTRFEEGARINRVDLILPPSEHLSDQERDVKDYIESHKQKIKNREL